MEDRKVEDRKIKMDGGSRVKQFMPFDKLKGFLEAVEEKERM